MAIRIEPRLSPISIRAPMRRLWNINFPARVGLLVMEFLPMVGQRGRGNFPILGIPPLGEPIVLARK